MGLDIRVPIGMLFLILGLLLIAYGIISDPAIYARSLGININIWWGLCLTLFGAGMFFFGRRGARTSGMRPSLESPEGIATEKREHQLGLEREE